MVSLKVVCFDLDDTICDLGDGHQKTRLIIIDKLSRESDYPRDAVARIYDIEWAIFKQDYMALVSEGLDEQDIRERHIESVLDGIALETSAGDYARLFGTETLKELHIFPDARRVMDALGKKYRLTMITNGASVWQRAKIEKLSIEDYFEEIIVSGELGHHKPSSKIFEEMTRRTQVDASEIIYIGNNYMKDVVGAKESGWKAAWVKRKDEERDESVPDYVINELSELLEII